jgi:hypothetical protein
MVAGLPKDPIERARSTVLPFAASLPSQSAWCPTSDPIAQRFGDASLGTEIGGFYLRGEARSIGI